MRGLVVARYSPASSVIVDYCGPADDEDLMTALVSAARDAMAARGTLRMRCETTHAPMLAALHRVGFIGSRYRPRFRVRTNLPGDERPLEGWFLMPGDSDGDLLSSLDEAPLPAYAASSPSAPFAASAR